MAGNGIKKKWLFFYGVEHILVDHVAAGVTQPFAFSFLLDECKEREFHVSARHMAKHLLEFDLLGVHEQRVRDLSRAEFLALAAVDARVRDVGKADEMEHEVRRQLPGGHVRRVLGRAVHAVTDGTG